MINLRPYVLPNRENYLYYLLMCRTYHLNVLVCGGINLGEVITLKRRYGRCGAFFNSTARTFLVAVVGERRPQLHAR